MKGDWISHDTHRLALGCMGLGGSWNDKSYDQNHIKQAHSAIETALEEGIHFFDHADIYARGKAEAVFGEILKSKPGLREKIFIQTKCGIRLPGDPPGIEQGRYDFSRKHILDSVDQSLMRLKTEYLDMLLLHRPDPLVEPEEVAEAFENLNQNGKVREFGVSNHTPAQMELLLKYLTVPIRSNQIEFHLLHSGMLDGGIAGSPNPVDPSGLEGTIEFCRIHQIQIQAWSPISKGFLSGRSYQGKDGKLKERILKCKAKIDEFSKKHQAPAEAIVVSWILHHPARILPVLGSKNPDRIRRCARSLEVKLSREEWFELYCLGRGSNLP